MEKKLCVFDLGNVVLDQVDVIPEIRRRVPAAAATFLRLYEQYVLDLMIGAMDAGTFWSKVSSEAGVVIDTDLLEECFTPVPNASVIDIIKSLKEAGAKVVCGSNTYDSHYRSLEHSESLAHFDEQYVSHLMELAKPDPRFFRYIMEAEGCTADQVFFTDDLEENVDAAAALGIHAHLFTDAASLRKSLDQFLN